MRDLASYPISFPYGVTTDPYTPSHPHRGDDRAAPLNTPIIIQGITIGYVGMTGFASGYHCHNQEWQGNKLNVRKPQNAFKGGVVIEVDPIGNSGDGSLGKYVTIRNDDGWNTSYCHMNSVNSKVGDIIKQGGTTMKWNNGDTYNLLYKSVGLGTAEEAKKANYVGYFGAQDGQEYKSALETIINSLQYGQMVQKAQAPQDVKPYDGPQLFVKG